MKIAYFAKGRPEALTRIPKGIEHVVIEPPLNGVFTPEQLAKVADVDAFYVFNGIVNEQIIAAAKKLKIVQRPGVGFDSIDLEAAKRHSVYVCNTAGNNRVKVAEHTMMLMLAVAQHAVPVHELTRQARWEEARSFTKSHFEFKGKQIGIVGFGNIGTELAKRARGFEMQIVYNDIKKIDPQIIETTGARFMEKEELFATSDVVSVHTPLTAKTRGLVDAGMLARMKPTSILICCARGNIVDEPALRRALDEGKLAGAGIDVYSVEPVEKENPLLGAKNIVLSSHIAGGSMEGSKRAIQLSHENIRALVEDGVVPKWQVQPDD
ncbi:MAG: hypothetical protein HY423_14115 [Candidatus Lambdaproteobacteria bacterium]|nr:hypothetical protein [Candidatus Lambdaproteobacteria bacterium]